MKHDTTYSRYNQQVIQYQFISVWTFTISLRRLARLFGQLLLQLVQGEQSLLTDQDLFDYLHIRLVNVFVFCGKCKGVVGSVEVTSRTLYGLVGSTTECGVLECSFTDCISLIQLSVCLLYCEHSLIGVILYNWFVGAWHYPDFFVVVVVDDHIGAGVEVNHYVAVVDYVDHGDHYHWLHSFLLHILGPPDFVCSIGHLCCLSGHEVGQKQVVEV